MKRRRGKGEVTKGLRYLTGGILWGGAEPDEPPERRERSGLTQPRWL